MAGFTWYHTLDDDGIADSATLDTLRENYQGKYRKKYQKHRIGDLFSTRMPLVSKTKKFVFSNKHKLSKNRIGFGVCSKKVKKY